jgi:hypothetical protein
MGDEQRTDEQTVSDAMRLLQARRTRASLSEAGKKGARRRFKGMSKAQRAELATKAARARWDKVKAEGAP